MSDLIMAPVDLEHEESLGAALECAADLAKSNDAVLCYVGATSAVPNALGNRPAEHEKTLKAFIEARSGKNSLSATHHVTISHDPVTVMDDVLMTAVKETGVGLVAMATHKPGLGDCVWPSNGGKSGAHADVSVFLVCQ